MPRTKQPPRLRDRIIDLRRLPASALQDHQHNWRVHPQAQREALQGVLHELGIASALLVYESPRQGGLCVIDGHLRKSLDPTQEWPCLMLDLDDDEASYLLATHDPLGAMAEASREALERVLHDVTSGQAAVQELLAQLAEQHGVVPADTPGPLVDVEPEIDRAEELRQQYGVEMGQLWACGEHRVICGDCTDKEVVERVLGDVVPVLMVTDPPYGVEYDAAWRNEAAAKGYLAYAARRTRPVTNDDRMDWSDAWRLFPGDVAYTWSPPGDHIILTGLALQSAGYAIRNQIMWRKPHFPISRGHYTYQHEPCWYAVKHNAMAHWIGDCNASTVWDIVLDRNVEGGHSTQKPLECMARPIRNHAAPDVYDPFLGSGTTLIAAHQLQRRCYGCEIDPGYVAVTLHRYATLTGETPVLVDG
jgi:DNA modification methylase